jgi:hypothetical protein
VQPSDRFIPKNGYEPDHLDSRLQPNSKRIVFKITTLVGSLSDQMISVLRKSCNHRLLCLATRPISDRSDLSLIQRMKMLNQKKQHVQVLNLFDEHKQETKTNHLSSSVITQALKASTQLGDLRRGQAIHRLVSSRAKTDCYILSSLIHLYSEFCCFDADMWLSIFSTERSAMR